jgi:predicted AAA+ superfamily ATPase
MAFPDFMASVRRARETLREIHHQPPQRRHSWRRLLERYYNRGGYPRLYASESEAIEDRWADYLVETVFERVLGVDIPDLFPVEQPQLLRHIYLEVARRTGTEVSQGALTADCNAAGFRTAQPVVGRYLHYLADAMLICEFRRYPLARRRTARVPVKITLTDLGVRNAIFRGAPSLWESAPDVVGPLVERAIRPPRDGPPSALLQGLLGARQPPLARAGGGLRRRVARWVGDPDRGEVSKADPVGRSPIDPQFPRAL